MLPHKHTKEGVLNEKLALKKLLTYMKSVYKIPQKIKGLSDERKRKSIPLFNIVMPVLIFLMLQYESFHTIFSAPESMEKQLKNCIRGKIPKVDAVRDLLSRIDPKEIEEIHAQTIDVLKRNRVFREGTIGGYVAAGIDGMELFSSTKKSCTDCLSRKNGTGKTKYFHRSVVCMTVGKSPHVIFGQEMLKPRDGSEKDEGELTGAKRLIRHLKKRHGHFADVIVADALYLNAPFINTLKECGLETVIRLKDERRLLFQDAESMFQRDEGRKRSFRKEKKSIEVWDLSGFEIDLDGILSGLKYEDGHYDLVSLSDKDYQKKLDVQIACWDKLKNEIQKVGSGENGTAGLVDMRETYFQMADETVAAVKVSRANRQLEQKAYIDLHTGLPNKSKCEELFHNVEFIKTPTACIVFDMNNLKRVNDSLGHSIGDQLILNFARLLRNSIPAKHFVGRYGGDELWRSSMMQPAKASQKSSQSFRTKSNSSTATEPSSASAIPTAWHFPPITTNVRSACCLTKQISICMKTSRDARTKETPEPEISYRRFWRFFLLFLFYFFANASICAYPAEKSMGSSRSFFLTASRPS